MTTSADLRWTIGRAQSGDQAALNDVLLAAARLAAPVTRRIAGADGDDVLQGVLWTVARKLPWLDEPDAFKAWVYRIATRAALKHATRERRFWPVGSRDDLEAIGGAGPPSEPPDVSRIPEFLALVTPRSRAVIVLHYLEEMTLEDVAAVLDIPLGTVKSRLAFGLRLMRAGVREQER